MQKLAVYGWNPRLVKVMLLELLPGFMLTCYVEPTFVLCLVDADLFFSESRKLAWRAGMRRASVAFILLLLLFNSFTSISASIVSWRSRSQSGAQVVFEIDPAACDLYIQIDASRWSYESGARIDFTIGGTGS